MRSDISFTVSPADRQRLRAIAVDPKSPQKHVWRARIVLLSDDGLGTSAIMSATAKSKTCVWRWQERFMDHGKDSRQILTQALALNDIPASEATSASAPLLAVH